MVISRWHGERNEFAYVTRKKRAESRLNIPLRDGSQELATEKFQNFGQLCPSAIAYLSGQVVSGLEK